MVNSGQWNAESTLGSSVSRYNFVGNLRSVRVSSKLSHNTLSQNRGTIKKMNSTRTMGAKGHSSLGRTFWRLHVQQPAFYYWGKCLRQSVSKKKTYNLTYHFSGLSPHFLRHVALGLWRIAYHGRNIRGRRLVHLKVSRKQRGENSITTSPSKNMCYRELASFHQAHILKF